MDVNREEEKIVETDILFVTKYKNKFFVFITETGARELSAITAVAGRFFTDQLIETCEVLIRYYTSTVNPTENIPANDFDDDPDFNMVESTRFDYSGESLFSTTKEDRVGSLTFQLSKEQIEAINQLGNDGDYEGPIELFNHLVRFMKVRIEDKRMTRLPKFIGIYDSLH